MPTATSSAPGASRWGPACGWWTGRGGRGRRIAASALEQSGGARLPELSGPHTPGELPTLLAAAGPTVCLDPAAASPLDPAGRGPAGLLVGPEGGWSTRELAFFAALGLASARLGPRLLRVETAAVAAAAILLHGAAPEPDG
jgi:16S rRNA (uracil1498-N3)-methyltransferase